MHIIAAHQAQTGIEILDGQIISNSEQVSNAASAEPQNPCYNPDWLRSFKGCEHYSDAEALAISESLNNLAKILLEST